MHEVTRRFNETFKYLKTKGIVKSARQYALEIGAFPQAMNEVLKGRREVTIDMLYVAINRFELNPNYLFKGSGHITSNTHDLPTTTRLSYLSITHYQSFLKNNIDVSVSKFPEEIVLPSNLVNHNTQLIAVQVNENYRMLKISTGDILICQKLVEPISQLNLQLGNYYLVRSDSVICLALYQGKSLYDQYKWSSESAHFMISPENLKEVWIPKFKLAQSTVLPNIFNLTPPKSDMHQGSILKTVTIS